TLSGTATTRHTPPHQCFKTDRRRRSGATRRCRGRGPGTGAPTTTATTFTTRRRTPPRGPAPIAHPRSADEPPLPPPAPEPAPAPRAAERQEESPWQQFFCRTYNQHYYHNRTTGETTWTLPDALAPTQAEAAQQAPAEPPRAAGAAAASPQEPEWDRHWSEAHA
ncbi:unnamed protein product, partial [Prorocentrum cordatum]